MKHFFIVVVLLSCTLFVNCRKEKPFEETITKTISERPLVSELDTFYLGGTLVHVEKIKKSDFESIEPVTAVDTSEIVNLNRDNGMAGRKGDTLIFKTKAKQATLINNDDDDADTYAQYTYCGYMKNIDQFLVSGTFYESYGYSLIDARTGDETVLWGKPVVSPDGNYIISGNSDLVTEFTNNGIQLFENTHKPKLIAEKLLQSWGPEEIKWVDDKTLYVKVNVSDINSPDLETTAYFELMLDL